MTIIGFQNTILNASEDNRRLRFDIAVLYGILRVNVSINFTTNDSSAQGISFLIVDAQLIIMTIYSIHDEPIFSLHNHAYSWARLHCNH